MVTRLPFLLVVIVLSGCGSSLTYHYTIGITSPEIPVQGAQPGIVRGQPDATITVIWNDGRMTAVLHDEPYSNAKHFDFTERVSWGTRVFAGTMPKGFEVHVIKPGYKPWDAWYRVTSLLADEQQNFYRMDTIEMQPVANDLPTTRTSSSP